MLVSYHFFQKYKDLLFNIIIFKRSLHSRTEWLFLFVRTCNFVIFKNIPYLPQSTFAEPINSTSIISYHPPDPSSNTTQSIALEVDPPMPLAEASTLHPQWAQQVYGVYGVYDRGPALAVLGRTL